MDIRDIPLPDIYMSSEDFRFFVEWFRVALSKVKYDTENIFDLYDVLRCPTSLLWLLGDTIGYKYDDRVSAACNRMVILYFMNMIKLKGSLDGMTLAAETNISQHNINSYGESNPILFDRLEDTTLPVNSVYVNSHVDEGYIEVVYFSTERPIDVCTEYVRPLGMYMFDYAGVRCDARNKLTVDARLTNSIETDHYSELDDPTALNPTQILKSSSVAHYTREDYARLQKGDGKYIDDSEVVGGFDPAHTRRNIWYRNSIYEESGQGATSSNPVHQTEATSSAINPGYRALYSLQLCNNDHIIRALIRSAEHPEGQDLDPIFSIPVVEVDVSDPPPTTIGGLQEKRYNLEYNRAVDETYTHHQGDTYDVYTTENRGANTTVAPYATPAVNPAMFSIGEALSLDNTNSSYYPDTPGTETPEE